MARAWPQQKQLVMLPAVRLWQRILVDQLRLQLLRPQRQSIAAALPQAPRPLAWQPPQRLIALPQPMSQQRRRLPLLLRPKGVAMPVTRPVPV